MHDSLRTIRRVFCTVSMADSSGGRDVPHKRHLYRVVVEWTGNHGPGTVGYTGYSRDHIITAGAKAPITGSSDSAFLGDPTRWNPEDLLVASISACHKLWYLHLCSVAGIVVIAYRDKAEGVMAEDATGAGRFVSAVLRPHVIIRAGCDIEQAHRLHHDAHTHCFIANSLNFPVLCEPAIAVEGGPQVP
jgi:organic hydroperoxide reductase OsmC/OhrA